MHAKSLQSCLTLCNLMNCNPPNFSVHGLLQARILEWAAISSSSSFLVAQMVKESACHPGDQGLIAGWGRSPREGNGYPLQYSCLENPMHRGAWQATVHPWGCKELDRTQWLTLTNAQPRASGTLTQCFHRCFTKQSALLLTTFAEKKVLLTSLPLLS